MNERNIRKYPPLAVCGLVAVAMFAGSVLVVSREAETAPITPEPIAVESAVVFAQLLADYTVQETPIVVEETAAPKVEEEVADAVTEETSDATEITASSSLIQSRDWGSDDSYRLMKIAMAEAEGESVEGKALVMLVVLNRVWSNQFPDTIEEVIFQPNQFSPVREGGRWYTTEPNEECAEALKLVMSGWDESRGALYFESCGNDSWHSRNLEFLYQVGNHKFYR